MLRRIVLICALLSVFTQPVVAGDRTYLIYQQGEQRSSDMWVGPEPTKEQIGEFAHALPWMPAADENGVIDRNPLNYVNANGNVRRAPPVVEVVETKPVPNVDQFFEDMIMSGKFTEEEIVKALIASKVKDDTKRNGLILQMVAGSTPERQQELADIAKKNAVELPIGDPNGSP